MTSDSANHQTASLDSRLYCPAVLPRKPGVELKGGGEELIPREFTLGK